MVRKIGWADIFREVAARHLQASDLYLGFDDESRPYLFQEQILGYAVRWCSHALQ
jgi:20S proteasome alpha/beta subunit